MARGISQHPCPLSSQHVNYRQEGREQHCPQLTAEKGLTHAPGGGLPLAAAPGTSLCTASLGGTLFSSAGGNGQAPGSHLLLPELGLVSGCQVGKDRGVQGHLRCLTKLETRKHGVEWIPPFRHPPIFLESRLGQALF